MTTQNTAANGGQILTDERIAEIADATGMMAKNDVLSGLDGGLFCIDFARAIEADLRASFAAVPASEPVAWRCFHCDESFTTTEAAQLHFGTSERQGPACQIDVTKLREMEARIRECTEEDSDLHRQMYSMQVKHATALLREEEKGYARGLRDAAAPAPVSGMPDLSEAMSKIQHKLRVMLASATALDDGDCITGYQIKNGALHQILGIMAGAGYSVTIPLPSAATLGAKDAVEEAAAQMRNEAIPAIVAYRKGIPSPQAPDTPAPTEQAGELPPLPFDFGLTGDDAVRAIEYAAALAAQQAPAKAVNGDAIAKSKRILNLVDEYELRPTSGNRTTLRMALMAEFEAVGPAPDSRDAALLKAAEGYIAALDAWENTNKAERKVKTAEAGLRAAIDKEKAQ